MLPRPQALRARDDAHFSWVFDFFTGIPQSYGMNPITALLGATGLLLVVAVVLSVMKMSHGDEEAEIRKLRAELDALNAQQGQLTPTPPQPASIPAPYPQTDPPQKLTSLTNPGSDPAEARTNDQGPGAGSEGSPSTPIATSDPTTGLVDTAPTRAELEAELAKAEQENELLKQEAREGLISKSMIESAKKQKARASTVKQAWLQAKVIEWVAKQPDKQSGGFAIIELHRDMQPGTVLAIRRQSGIYGRLMVDHIYVDKNQASANPVRGTFPDGEAPEIRPGDELILPPFGS